MEAGDRNAEFRVLGPLQAVRGGVAVAVRSPTQLAVLSALLMHANLPVDNDVLVDAVWEDRVPARAADTLRVHVSQLRKSLGQTVITTVAGGYVLRVGPEQVDSYAFEQEVAWAARLFGQGEDGSAYQQLSAALKRWRGDAYHDVRYRSFAQGEVRRLEELRAEALERRAAAALRLGLLDGLVAELTELVGAYPHREGLWGALIVALYRCGRQADALAAYRSARDLLVSDLGVEPGPQLRALERAVLAQDPALEPPAVPGVHLPAPMTSFVGRAGQLARAAGLLTQARLATLVGPGGGGKTRLAVEVARHAASSYQGVWFVDLAQVPAGEDPAGAVLAALGRPGRHPADASAIAAALAGQPALLLFDNCEHLVEAAGLLAGEVLTRCPALTVLATSREPLRVPGEALLHVPPLDLPAVGATADGGAESEAVLLFLDRARDVVPGLQLDEATRGPLYELVRLTGGIPLAIELAAARVDTMSLEDAVMQASAAFGASAPAARVAVPRHRTLHAALEWSRRLLSPQEQEIFSRLWVFSDGWGLDALAALCADLSLPSEELLQRLVRLAETSMVAVQRRGPEVRYALLEPVRQYARALATDEGARRVLLRRHVGHFHGLAVRLGPAVRGGDAAARRQFEADEANMVAALAQLLGEQAADSAAELATALTHYWGHIGRHDRARLWTGRALQQLPALTPAYAIDLIRGAVWNAGLGGDLNPSGLVRMAEETLARSHDTGANGQLLGQLANLPALRGDVRTAIPIYKSSYRLLRQAGEPRSFVPLFNLTWNYACAGQARLADRLAQRLAALTNEPASRGMIVALRGLAALYTGAHNDAASYLDEALAPVQAHGLRAHQVLVITWRGSAALALGDPQMAQTLAGQALRLAGEPPVVTAVFTRELLAWTALASRDLPAARQAIDRVAALSLATGSAGGPARLLDPAALLEHRQGADDRATILLAAATRARDDLGLARTAYERQCVAETIETLRRNLGSGRYQQLAGQGMALAVDDAVTLATGATLPPVHLR